MSRYTEKGLKTINRNVTIETRNSVLLLRLNCHQRERGRRDVEEEDDKGFT